MACFGRVVLFLVLLTVVVAYSGHGRVVSTPKPILSQNCVNKFREGTTRTGTAILNVYNIPNRVADGKVNTDFHIMIEQRFAQEKLNGEVNNSEDFWQKRNELANLEVQQLLGNQMPLDEKELQANKIILAKRYVEYDRSLNYSVIFPPSMSFMKVKNLIEQSEIYKIIKKIPKGASLYNMLITSPPISFMYELTYEDNLYFRFEDNLQFKFSRTQPGPGWKLLSQVRNTNNIQYFEDLNKKIEERLSLVNPNTGPNNSTATLGDVLQIYASLTIYKPNLIRTFRKTLETLYEDNIMYAELGYDFPEVYDLDGKIYTPLEILTLFKTILSEFIQTHKDFIGVRFMYSPLSMLTNENLRSSRIKATALWKAHPELISSFGLIRMGETQKPWSYFAEELLKFPKEIKFFLDAGVTTNWGTDADNDLLDALTLNTAGIGEGIAINKHPAALQLLREKGVPVIVFAITAQAMNYVKDLRLHPATLLVASDSPMVIGNAGGNVFNNTGLSYDWYEVYMAMTPRFCDLRCLKQFAVNSWLYCNLSNEEKKRNIRTWKVMWDKFIDYVISNYN